MSAGLTFEKLSEAFAEQTLFEDKTWRISPEAWSLTSKQIKEIEQIGQACLEFYRATELLYTRSHQGKNILRNAELKAPWVADYLDRGKPELSHSAHSLESGAPHASAGDPPGFTGH